MLGMYLFTQGRKELAQSLIMVMERNLIKRTMKIIMVIFVSVLAYTWYIHSVGGESPVKDCTDKEINVKERSTQVQINTVIFSQVMTLAGCLLQPGREGC